MSGFEIFHSFPEAVTAGIIIAATCSFLGVFIVLKRLVFIGATLSEVATCGLAASLYFHIHPFLGAVAFTLAAVTLLAFTQEEYRVPSDAIMAVLFILSSSLAILLVSKSSFGLDEVKSFLYGDLILTSRTDLKILFLSIVPTSAIALIFMRPITYTFVDRDESKVLGIKVRLWELLFYYMMGIVISAASKLGGMLLVFCFLVVPPVTGLILSNRLAGAILISLAAAIFSTLTGFYFSYTQDLPANQVIAVMACIILGVSFLMKYFLSLIKK